MRATSLRLLAGVVLAVALATYLLAEAAYGSLPEVPGGAPVPLLLVAVAELALAKAVRDRVLRRTGPDGRPPRRPLHPLQVARLAALAKASSPAGAVLLGAYGGLFAWTAQHADRLAAASDDVTASGLAALAALALVVAALLLERACRVPTPPDSEEERGLGSPA